MKLYCFKENETKAIAITDQGEVDLSKEEIRHLWFTWMTHKFAIRSDEDDFAVYGFSEPVDYEEIMDKGKSKCNEMLYETGEIIEPNPYIDCR